MAVQSCIAQALPFDWEVVCCDDGSQDHTFQYMSDRYRSNRNVRVYHHAANMGQTAARKTCFDVATGDWFFTLDHDNVLPVGLVVRLVKCQEETGRHAVSPKELYFYKDCVLKRLASWGF